MPQGRKRYDHNRLGRYGNAVSMRDNMLAAIVVALLLAAAAGLADGLAETSQSCYRMGGGCGAWGVPAAEISFQEFFQQ